MATTVDGAGGGEGACSSSSPSSSSGAGGALVVCSLPVYPKVVTASLRKIMKEIDLTDEGRRKIAIHRMTLPETLHAGGSGIKAIRDASIIELMIDATTVKEVDVMRGRELIRQQLEPGSQWSTTEQQKQTPTTEPVIPPSATTRKRGSLGSICLVVRRPG